MSEATKPITVFMTLTWEFVPKSTPGYKKAVLVWLDVTDCGRESEFPAPEGTYQKESKEWTIGHDGELLMGIGHVHDGLFFPSPLLFTFLSTRFPRDTYMSMT